MEGRPDALASSVGLRSPEHSIASLLELRRSVNFLQVIAHDPAPLAQTLAGPPYHMPATLIRNLGATGDIQSLVRRIGHRGVHFEVSVAAELIMLTSQTISWYHSYRTDE